MKKNPWPRYLYQEAVQAPGLRRSWTAQPILRQVQERRKKRGCICKEKNVTLTGHKVALDGIVPVVHPSMKINDITTEQLRDIYNGKIKSWKELGGPDRPVSVVSRTPVPEPTRDWRKKY